MNSRTIFGVLGAISACVFVVLVLVRITGIIYEQELKNDSFQPVVWDGFSRGGYVSVFARSRWVQIFLSSYADDPRDINSTASKLIVLENGQPLKHAPVLARQQVDLPQGGFWHVAPFAVRITSSDGSDPRTSGKVYTVKGTLVPRLPLILFFVIPVIAWAVYLNRQLVHTILKRRKHSTRRLRVDDSTAFMLTVVGATLVSVSVPLWALNKGMCYADEGVSLLLISSPKSYYTHIFFQYLIYPFHVIFGSGVLLNRVLNFVARAIASAALASCFLLCVRQKLKRSLPLNTCIVVVGVILCGAMNTYSYTVNTMSYNDVAFAFCAFGFSMLLLPVGKRRWLSMFFAGLFFGFMVYGKPTAIVILALALLVGWKTLRLRRWDIVAYVAGAIASCSAMLFYWNLDDLYNEIDLLRFYFVSGQMHLGYTGGGVFAFASRLIYDLFLLSLLAVPGVLLLRNIDWHERSYGMTLYRYIVTYFVLMIVALHLSGIYISKFPFDMNRIKDNYAPSLIYIVFALSFLGLQVHRIVESKSVQKEWLLSILALVIPFFLAFGTNERPVSEAIYPHLAFTYIYYLYVYYFCEDNTYVRGLARLAIAFCVVLSTYQTVEGSILNLRGQTDITQCTAPVPCSPRASGILLPPAEADGICRLSSALKNHTDFKPNDVILPIYWMPGVVYMLDGTSPYEFLYRRDTIQLACYRLDRYRAEFSGAFLLITKTPDRELDACLRAHGVRFPEDYVCLGTAPLYIPGNLDNSREVRLYAPRWRITTGGATPLPVP